MSYSASDSENLIFEKSFSGLEKLYGSGSLNILKQSKIMVIGLGGVGSWVAESLARSAIGHISLLDLDNIALSNINRQLLATTKTIGMAKVEAIKSRILEINPICNVITIEDFINSTNVMQYLNPSFDFVIDCIDAVNEKAAVVAFCKRNKIKLVVTGGTGGKTDVTQLTQLDLAKTFHDPLLAKLRRKLKDNHKITTNKNNRFDIPCFFSTEQSLYLNESGLMTQQKHKSTSGLNCHHGMGSLMAMTASMGLAASSFAIKSIISQSRMN